MFYKYFNHFEDIKSTLAILHVLEVFLSFFLKNILEFISSSFELWSFKIFFAIGKI